MHGSNPAKNFDKGGVSEKSGALSLLFEFAKFTVNIIEGNTLYIKRRITMFAFINDFINTIACAIVYNQTGVDYMEAMNLYDFMSTFAYYRDVYDTVQIVTYVVLALVVTAIGLLVYGIVRNDNSSEKEVRLEKVEG